MLKNFLHIILTIQTIKPNIILTVLIDLFKDCWIDDVADSFRFDIGKIFIVFYLFFFVHSQPEQPTKIGIDEFSAYGGVFDFWESFLEDVDFD